jgi:hypothetical protein
MTAMPGDPDQLADPMGLAGDVHPEHASLARVDREQRREHSQHRCLPGPVRTEDAEDLALTDLQVDAVDGADFSEGLNQASCGHAGCRHRCASLPRPYWRVR